MSGDVFKDVNNVLRTENVDQRLLGLWDLFGRNVDLLPKEDGARLPDLERIITALSKDEIAYNLMKNIVSINSQPKRVIIYQIFSGYKRQNFATIGEVISSCPSPKMVGAWGSEFIAVLSTIDKEEIRVYLWDLSITEYN